MALRGRRINNFAELWCLVASRGVEICVSSTSFQKNDIGWPQQPLTERVSDISKKLDFWWSIPHKWTNIGHFGARDDQNIRISKFFDEMRLLRSLRPLRLSRPLSSLRPGKSLLRTSESSRHLNSALFLCFEKKWGYNHKISYWILAPLLLEAVEASQCNSFENWLMKHKCPILLNPLCTIIR